MHRLEPKVRCALGASWLLVLAVGCQTLTPASIPETLTLASASSPASGTVEAIRFSLATESWRPNRTWTPQSECLRQHDGFPAPADLRWTFAADLPSDV